MYDVTSATPSYDYARARQQLAAAVALFEYNNEGMSIIFRLKPKPKLKATLKPKLKLICDQ